MVVSGLREFTFSSLHCSRTTSGRRVSINRQFGTDCEISAYMLSVANVVKFQNMGNPASLSKKDEPTVRDPKTTEKILVACGASNLPSLQTALSLNAGIFADLATIRNFYAHRNFDTCRKVQAKAMSMAAISIKHPNELVVANSPPTPVTFFDEWIAEAQIFFDELTK